MLDMASGHRVAVELELTAKSSGRMSRIMSAYASDSRIDHVLYLVANRSIAARVQQSAHRAGIPERVHVQRARARRHRRRRGWNRQTRRARASARR